MVRLFPVFVLALFLYVVPSAFAEPSPTQTAQHQEGLNTESGADATPDSDAPPGATPEESVRFAAALAERIREIGAACGITELSAVLGRKAEDQRTIRAG